MTAMASRTKLWGDCKGHKSVKTCKTCLPIRTKLWSIRQSDEWRERRRVISLAHKRKVAAEKVLTCPLCGAPREKRKWYCKNCREASRGYSQTKSRAERRRAGWKPNLKKRYRSLVAKYGKEELARRAREAYHRKRFRRMESGA